MKINIMKSIILLILTISIIAHVTATPIEDFVNRVKYSHILSKVYAYDNSILNGVIYDGSIHPNTVVASYNGQEYNQMFRNPETTYVIEGEGGKAFVGLHHDPLLHTIIVLFRGTDNNCNIKHDLMIERVPFILPHTSLTWPTGMKVHEGFLTHYEGLRVGIIKAIEKLITGGGGGSGATHVLVTGHSLGGATSNIAVMHLKDKFIGLTFELVTFGSPRVGNEAFVSSLNAITTSGHHIRFVQANDNLANNSDAVSTIPWSTDYYHAGFLYVIYINTDKKWKYVYKGNTLNNTPDKSPRLNLAIRTDNATSGKFTTKCIETASTMPMDCVRIADASKFGLFNAIKPILKKVYEAKYQTDNLSDSEVNVSVVYTLLQFGYKDAGFGEMLGRIDENQSDQKNLKDMIANHSNYQKCPLEDYEII